MITNSFMNFTKNISSLLEVKNLCKSFPVESGLFRTRGVVDAVKDVSFRIGEGELVALVGESGSGKTTLGKMVQGLLAPTSGEILLSGENSKNMPREKRAHLVQMIFQDPFASLNPKLSVGAMLSEAIKQSLEFSELRLATKNQLLRTFNAQRSTLNAKLSELLESVGLPTNILNDYPHQFSGGQRQRLVIARALAMQPKLIIADEPVSALDVSIQAQILNLLLDLKKQYGISYLLITHDLSLVKKIANRVLVMKNGRIIEEGETETIFRNPAEPYTQSLFSAMDSVAI